MRACGIALAVGGLSSAAIGQAPATNGRFEFEFDRLVVSPQNPSVTLTVYAAWDQANPGDWAFGAADYDLAASDGLFTSAMLLLGMDPPNHAGMPSGSRVNGAAIGQAFGPFCGIAGCPDENPVGLTEYIWVATDFAPQTVSFSSENSAYFTVVSISTGIPVLPAVNLYPGQFRAGSGSVTVVPGPAGVVVFASWLACVWRRRR